jgi:DNA-binding transcriptional regulator YiaG
MSEISSFRDVIGLWPSHDALASDIGAPVTAVRKWSQRERIPAEWWDSVLSTRTAEAAGITAGVLTKLAARESLEARA